MSFTDLSYQISDKVIPTVNDTLSDSVLRKQLGCKRMPSSIIDNQEWSLMKSCMDVGSQVTQLEDVGPTKPKRPYIEDKIKLQSDQPKFSNWLAMCLETAESSASEFGCSFGPITKIELVLGSFHQKRIIAKCVIRIGVEHSLAFNTYPDYESDETKRMKLNKDSDGEQVAMQTKVQTQSWLNNCDILDETLIPITETSLYAHSLNDAIQQVDDWIINHKVETCQSSNIATTLLVTEDHNVIRNILHAEAGYRGVNRDRMNRSPWSVYINLTEIYTLFVSNVYAHGNEETSEVKNLKFSNIGEAYDHFQKHQIGSTHGASRKADQLAEIMNVLVCNAFCFGEPNIVRTVYEHKTLSRKLQVDDKLVIELRQVPWSATPASIANFFAGLNVISGGVAIRLTDGRRSNTAIVAFENELCAKLALTRHQCRLCDVSTYGEQKFSDASLSNTAHLTEQSSQFSSKPVYLQVHPASGREFVQCAGCDQKCVIEFLNQLTDGEQVVVRVRGLPYATTKQEILEFFAAIQAPVMLGEYGIFLVNYPDRRPTGDAFVLFKDDITAGRALTRHKDYLGDRYVELFKASPSEMVQVCYNVAQQLSNTVFNCKPRNPLLDFHPVEKCATGLTETNPVSICSSTPMKLLEKNTQLKFMKPGITGNMIPDKRLVTLGWNSSPMQVASFYHQHNESSFQGPIKLTGFTQSRPQLFDPLFKDPTDPTDPDCVFARPLPPSGAKAIVQLHTLPFNTSRHEIRLYLGPANFAKIYRLKRMDANQRTMTSSWLLSLASLSEAIQLIRDLVGRPFSVASMDGCFRRSEVLPNIPTFALYHVDSNGTICSISLNDTNNDIPQNRIFGASFGSSSSDCPISPHWPSPNVTEVSLLTTLPNIMSTQTNNHPTYNLIQALMAQNPLVNSAITGCQLSNENINSSTFVNLINSHCLTSTLDLNPTYPSGPFTLTPVSTNSSTLNIAVQNVAHPNLFPFGSGHDNAASAVVVTGVPMDVTQAELQSIFTPISHLIANQPRFNLLNNQTDGTANYLAIFNNPIDAHTAVYYCPRSSLRLNQYAIGTACLIPLNVPMDSDQSPIASSFNSSIYLSQNKIPNLSLFPS